MTEASRGVGTVIKLGKWIIEDDQLMEQVMEKLNSFLPVNQLKQRLHQSYSLLIVSTLKVSFT